MPTQPPTLPPTRTHAPSHTAHTRTRAHVYTTSYMHTCMLPHRLIHAPTHPPTPPHTRARAPSHTASYPCARTLLHCLVPAPTHHPTPPPTCARAPSHAASYTRTRTLLHRLIHTRARTRTPPHTCTRAPSHTASYTHTCTLPHRFVQACVHLQTHLCILLAWHAVTLIRRMGRSHTLHGQLCTHTLTRQHCALPHPPGKGPSRPAPALRGEATSPREANSGALCPSLPQVPLLFSPASEPGTGADAVLPAGGQPGRADVEPVLSPASAETSYLSSVLRARQGESEKVSRPTAGLRRQNPSVS